MSVIKVKNNGKWETIPIIGSTSDSGVGKIDPNSDGTGEIFNDYVNNIASGLKSHSEGNNNKAIGQNAHAEGSSTEAIGPTTHTEGNNTIAYQNNSHAEGSNGIAFGQASHVEGLGETRVYGKFSITVNVGTKTVTFVTIENYLNPDKKPAIDATLINNICKFEGNNRLYIVQDIISINGTLTLTFDTVTGLSNGEVVMQTYNHYAKGPSSHVEGSYNITTAGYAHAEGKNNVVTGTGAHAEGGFNKASSDYAHAEGYKTTASGPHAHSENLSTVASGAYTHAEGDNTEASGDAAHAEGRCVVAKGFYSHAEGQCDLTVEAPFFSSSTELALYKTGAKLYYVTFPLKVGELFQYNNNIYKVNSIYHAAKRVEISPDFTEFITSNDYNNPTHIPIEPITRLAQSIGIASHHEGTNNCAYGKNSHVGGEGCQALGDNSFVHGKNLIACNGQIVFGKYNKYNEDDIFQIGYGNDSPYGRDNILSLTRAGVLRTYELRANSLTIPNKTEQSQVCITKIDRQGIVVYNDNAKDARGDNTIGLIVTSDGGNDIYYSTSSSYTTYAIIGSNTYVGGCRNVLAVGEFNHFNKLCNNSACIGAHNHACLSQSLAVGYNCTAYGNASIAFGGGGFESYGNTTAKDTLATYEQSYTTGEYPDGIHVAWAKQSMVTGKNNLALGQQSMANGEGNVAKNRHEFVVGRFNDYSNDTNNLFVVGNGTSHTERSNVLSVNDTGVIISLGCDLKVEGYENCNIYSQRFDDGNLTNVDALGSRLYSIRTALCFSWYETEWHIGNIRGSDTSSFGFGIANKNTLYFRVSENGIFANGNFNANQLYSSSDIRLKNNIQSIDADAPIDLVSFTWNDTGKKSYGIIAQQIEENYPELVELNDTTGYKTVNYNAALVVKCAQLEKRIEELEKLLQK